MTEHHQPTPAELPEPPPAPRRGPVELDLADLAKVGGGLPRGGWGEAASAESATTTVLP
jgi:hypothetical protein